MGDQKKVHDIRMGTEVETTDESPDEKEHREHKEQIKRWMKASKKRTI